MTSGATRSGILPCVSLIAARFRRTISARLATWSSSLKTYRFSESFSAAAAWANALWTSSGTSRIWMTLGIGLWYPKCGCKLHPPAV